MKNKLNTVPHHRQNILTGEWVLVSPHRTKRPWQGKKDKQPPMQTVTYDENCYLCPTNDRAGGAVNPDYKETFTFNNDFGAILADTEDIAVDDKFFKAKSEQGICKVICFSPNHSLTLPLMSVDEITSVVKLWKKEYKELGKNEFVNHVQIFENKGATMGCSNPHPHGQIWSQSTIPVEVKKKQKNQKKYWKKHNSSLLGDYIKKEIELDERIIFKNDDFVAFVPYWAVWPFEAMIAPIKQYRHIGQLNEKEERSFAECIQQLTIKYDNLFEVSFPYSAGIHQKPTDGKKHKEWHFHMSFYPPLLRSAEVKKFMVGYEMFATPQRDITAESAAERLKKLSNIHYSKQ